MTEAARKKKALVVEDEALIRMSVCDMLAEMGLETVDTGNGHEGLILLAEDPSIGMLIADLGLPDLSGEELVRRARGLRPELKIIISTGHSATLTQPAFAGVAFLAKPFDISGLRRAVEGA